ncbi:hypothetical protein Tco_0684148 [Tanacetum coccineum]
MKKNLYTTPWLELGRAVFSKVSSVSLVEKLVVVLVLFFAAQDLDGGAHGGEEALICTATSVQWRNDKNKNTVKSLREALFMTISLDLPKQILKAQTEARKPENIKNEDVED